MLTSRRRPPPQSPARLVRGLFVGAAAALAVFHGSLLWQRLLDGSLFEPVVAARWGASLLALGCLAVLRRAGAGFWRGERARTFWVLVLLLHAVPALGGEPAAIAPGGSGWLLALPAVAATGLLAASLPLAGARRVLEAPRLRARRLVELTIPAFAPGLVRCAASRAPPA